MRRGNAKRRNPAKPRDYAAVFAALGDGTRLVLVRKLMSAPPCSISRLTEGTRMTRQAIAKHVRVLERAGIVRSERSGRESLCVFEPGPIREAKAYLDIVSGEWDEALGRLKAFAEK
jgi:DNA-binding transcriptional ArsR family regulator